jgi:hypothetical protein
MGRTIKMPNPVVTLAGEASTDIYTIQEYLELLGEEGHYIDAEDVMAELKKFGALAFCNDGNKYYRCDVLDTATHEVLSRKEKQGAEVPPDEAARLQLIILRVEDRLNRVEARLNSCLDAIGALTTRSAIMEAAVHDVLKPRVADTTTATPNKAAESETAVETKKTSVQDAKTEARCRARDRERKRLTVLARSNPLRYEEFLRELAESEDYRGGKRYIIGADLPRFVAESRSYGLDPQKLSRGVISAIRTAALSSGWYRTGVEIRGKQVEVFRVVTARLLEARETRRARPPKKKKKGSGDRQSSGVRGLLGLRGRGPEVQRSRGPEV